MDSDQAFQEAREVWRAALREHVLAPPDAGFSVRIANLAAAAAQRAAACEAAHKDGYEWPAARGGAKPPYELQPSTGRRGPAALWERFDEAVAELDRVSEGRSMRAVGRAYADLAEVAAALAKAVEREDRGRPAATAVAKRRRSPARKATAGRVRKLESRFWSPRFSACQALGQKLQACDSRLHASRDPTARSHPACSSSAEPTAKTPERSAQRNPQSAHERPASLRCAQLRTQFHRPVQVPSLEAMSARLSPAIESPTSPSRQRSVSATGCARGRGPPDALDREARAGPAALLRAAGRPRRRRLLLGPRRGARRVGRRRRRGARPDRSGERRAVQRAARRVAIRGRQECGCGPVTASRRSPRST